MASAGRGFIKGLSWVLGRTRTEDGSFLWFLQKVVSLIVILTPFFVLAFFIREYQGFDRYHHEYRLDRAVHEYLDVPVTVWTSVGVLYISGTPVKVKRHVWEGQRGAPNLDTIYNSEKALWVGPSCTARKHVFLAIVFALAFPLLTLRRRLILAAATTVFTVLISGIRVAVLFHIHRGKWFDTIHRYDGYIIAVLAGIFWIVLAVWLIPKPPEAGPAGDETLLDDTPKTVAEKASEIKPPT